MSDQKEKKPLLFTVLQGADEKNDDTAQQEKKAPVRRTRSFPQNRNRPAQNGDAIEQQSAPKEQPKQAAANQTPVKQAQPKQPAVNQAPAKQAQPKQAAVNQTPVKQAQPKQAAANQAPAKQAQPKQAAANQAPAKQAQPKQPAANQTQPKPRQTQPKQAAAKQPAANVPVDAANAVAVTTGQQPQKGQRGRRPQKGKLPTVRIIPLGGLGEVGKNITVYECQGDAFIVDCGMTFPDESMPGIDLVLPDFSYVIENKDRIKGIAITHGHEDHIGGLPFLLKHVNLPIYATKLTVGLIEGKFREHGLLGKVKLNIVKPGDIVNFGCMSAEFINVNHSIPDACSLALHTPAGVIVQTGDFKIDFTPIRGDIINLARFGELGSKGVLALFSDSTNAERPGSTSSERTVGESFDKLFFQSAKKRIIVATFASNVHRVQQIVDAAVRYGRKVAVNGRSMENVVSKAMELGYLDVPEGVLVEVDAISRYPADKMVIVTTGSQGEPMSALTRMAMGEHRKVNVTPNDTIIISATPIPGNEKLVTRVVNELMKLGAEVVYERMYEVHVSGHACQDELKMMMALTKPKFFVPAHGEFKHLKKHAQLAASMGIPTSNIFVGDLGKVIETDGETMKFTDVVTAGKVLVDGLGVGDVGSIVLRDRKHLAQDGLIIVVITIDSKTGQIIAGPDIVSRGFVYVRESEDMIGKARNIAKECIQSCMKNNSREWGVLKQRVRDDVGDFLWQMTKRNPMILPVIQEVR